MRNWQFVALLVVAALLGWFLPLAPFIRWK